MKPNTIRTTLSHNSESSSGGRTTLNTTKPPIPPKPLVNSRLRPLADPRQELVSISGDGLITTGFHPATRYSSYPTAVLIKDENIPYIGDHHLYYNNSLETITPLLPVTYGEDKYNSTLYRSQLALNHALPPLTKAEITPSYMYTQSNPQAVELRNTTRSNNRTLSASAKNALLKEKIGGTISFSDNSKEILPRANSNPETGSNVTVNRSCIISVNNFNNSLSNNNIHNNNNNHNDTRHARNRQKKILSYDNTKPVSYNAETLNYALPLLPTSSLAKDDYMINTVDIIHNICANCNSYQVNCQCERHLYPLYVVAQGNTNESVVNTDKYINGEAQDNFINSKTFNTKSFNREGDEVDCSLPVERFKIIIHNGPSSYSSSQSAPCSPATKPLLRKSEAVDVDDYDYCKKLSRGISRATDNVNLVSKARSEIAQGIWDALESGNSYKNSPFFIETPVFTFTLPDLAIYSDEFRQFLEKDLIEMSTLISLEAAGRLNWWAIIGASQRLWPLATTGDGNCLLHAASLGMWGFHDRLLTLRKALHEFLTRSQYSQPLWRRWRWQLALQNRETGLVLSQNEWEEEWASVLRLASSAPRGGSQPQEVTTGSAPNLSNTATSLSQGKLNSEISGPVYESLEEIHVLALAHVLRRPIIVVADTTLKDMNGEPLAPIPFGGIYLPLECLPNECQRSPLILTYDAAHFSALVIMESNEKSDSSKPLPAVIPVTDCLHELLPVQFLVDPGEDFVWGRDELDDAASEKLITSQDQKGLLSDYLDLIQVPIPSTYLEASSTTLGHDDLSPHDLNDPLLDIDKKSSESSFDSDEGPPFSDGGFGSKGKAPKQLTTVVRSFGSIGRSMSKRIKKNLSKLGRTGSFRRKAPLLTKGEYNSKSSKDVKVATHQNFILAATIHTEKRQAYQQEMIENYLANARERFMRDTPSQKGTKLRDINTITSTTSPVTSTDTVSYSGMEKGMVQCINSGCNMYGNAQTSYMCASCFDRQKEQEEKEYQRQSAGDTKTDRQNSGNGIGDADDRDFNVHSPTSHMVRGDGIQYGAGRSKFYAQLDEASIKNATLIPVMQSKTGARDKTLFLSNSTFYNDTSVTSSIQSYNLNRDLRRESKKSRNGITKIPSDISISSRSPSSLSDPVSMVHVSSSGKDVLAPICIDDVRINVKKPDSVAPQKVNLPPSAPTTVADVNAYNIMQSKPCLTKGCEFYGNFATDNLCSKCHANKRKETLKFS